MDLNLDSATCWVNLGVSLNSVSQFIYLKYQDDDDDGDDGDDNSGNSP